MPNRFFISCKHCSYLFDLKPLLQEHKLDLHCPKCGKNEPNFIVNNSKSGMKLLNSALRAFKTEKDYNLAVLLSAKAADSYLSELFLKWTHISEARARTGNSKQSIDAKTLRALLKTTGFKPKVNKLLKNLPNISLSEFFATNSDIKELINSRFGSVTSENFVKDINTTLLNRGNETMHLGENIYSRSEAVSCINCAILFIMLFYFIDIKYTGRHPFPAKHGPLIQA